MSKKLIMVLVAMLLLITSLIILGDSPGSVTKSNDTRDIVEELENTTKKDVTGVVYQDYIEITKGGDTKKIYDKKDMFYVSIAPYITNTHSWTLHVLAGCQAELKNTDIQVKLVDEKTGNILYDGEKTTYNNGFMGFWLPRDMEVDISMEVDGNTGQYSFSTFNDSNTCLTEFKLQ